MIVYLMTINACNCYRTFFVQFSNIVSLLQVFNVNVFHITNFTVTSLIHYFLLDLIIQSILCSIYWAAMQFSAFHCFFPHCR